MRQVCNALKISTLCQDYQFDIQSMRRRDFQMSQITVKQLFTDGSLRFNVETSYVIIDRLSSGRSKWINTNKGVCELFDVSFERTLMNELWMKNV